MNICFFADGPWATIALKLMIAHEELDVDLVVTRLTPTDSALIKLAEASGIEIHAPDNVNGDDFLSLIEPRKIELGVSLSYNQIFRRPIINAFPAGIINCHAGKLPFYRGRNILNWAIINGEREFGITAHYVDEGIDTGDIILQRTYPIAPEDRYQTVLSRAQEACGPLLIEALELLARGQAERIPQTSIHPAGFYCGGRTFGDEWLDWQWPSKRIHDFVRGVTPPAFGAHTRYKQKVIAITRTELIPEAPSYLGTPGEVVGREGGAIIVKTGDSTIRVCEIADFLDGKLVNVRPPKFAIGQRFGINALAALAQLTERVKKLEIRANEQNTQ